MVGIGEAGRKPPFDAEIVKPGSGSGGAVAFGDIKQLCRAGLHLAPSLTGENGDVFTFEVDGKVDNPAAQIVLAPGPGELAATTDQLLVLGQQVTGMQIDRLDDLAGVRVLYPASDGGLTHQIVDRAGGTAGP